jgi:hypothetical protein
VEGRQCPLCGQTSGLIPDLIWIPPCCIRSRPEEALPSIFEAHGRIRRQFGLPPAAPQTEGGIECTLCAKACRLGQGEVGLPA